jgi:hypothetical protein
MTYTKCLLKFLFAIAIIGTAWQNKSYAGAFPVRPGRLLLSPSVTYFFANKQWDSTGVKKSFPGNGKFTSYGFSLYAEYGISRRFSAVALMPYVVNTYTQNGVNYNSSGLTDVELGLKYYLANINYVYYFAIQGTGIVPLYNSKGLGYAEDGAEVKLSFAGSGEFFDKNYYFNIDNAVRQYFGSGGPIQYRYNGTFGITLDKLFKNQLSISIGGFYTSSNFKQFNVLNPYTNKNFSFTQASLSYGHAFSRQFSAFLTGGQFLIGRNTSVGNSVSLSLVYRIGGI